MELRPATCRSAQLKAWTGLSGPQFHALITRLWRRRPDSGCGRPWSLAFGDRVLLVVLGYRTNLTMEQLAALSATTDSTVHRVTALAPHLAALLGPPPTDRRELWLVDGTLIPVHDQKKTKKSKNYRRSVNVQIVCRARDRRIVAVGDAWPGNRNDVVVFRETVGKTLPDHPRLSGDGGYQGIERIRSPGAGLTGKSSRTGPTGDSASAAPSPSTPSRASRTTRSSASAAAREKGSTTPSPASPPCTT
jgi:hypothetical protein